MELIIDETIPEDIISYVKILKDKLNNADLKLLGHILESELEHTIPTIILCLVICNDKRKRMIAKQKIITEIMDIVDTNECLAKRILKAL